MIRFGIGYDVHKLAPGRKLILGGVDIPHKLGLEAHSDGECFGGAIAPRIHAIIDAYWALALDARPYSALIYSVENEPTTILKFCASATDILVFVAPKIFEIGNVTLKFTNHLFSVAHHVRVSAEHFSFTSLTFTFFIL